MMKIIMALAALSTLAGSASAQDAPPKEVSIRDQIKADRAKDDVDNKTSGVARPWDRDSNGKRPWDKKGPAQAIEAAK
jgi:hypothetical protein